jgi:hypothetical protein
MAGGTVVLGGAAGGALEAAADVDIMGVDLRVVVGTGLVVVGCLPATGKAGPVACLLGAGMLASIASDLAQDRVVAMMGAAPEVETEDEEEAE